MEGVWEMLVSHRPQPGSSASSIVGWLYSSLCPTNQPEDWHYHTPGQSWVSFELELSHSCGTRIAPVGPYGQTRAKCIHSQPFPLLGWNAQSVWERAAHKRAVSHHPHGTLYSVAASSSTGPGIDDRLGPSK